MSRLCRGEDRDRRQRELRRCGVARRDEARGSRRDRDRSAEARRLMLTLYGKNFTSRLLLGTAQYPSPEDLKHAVEASAAEIVTVSLRRESARARTGQGFWALIEELGCRVLPNTAGCHTAKEAIATAEMARELFGASWIKLEVIANDDTLQPDLFGLVEAAHVLSADGFEVLPYTTEDLSVAE